MESITINAHLVFEVRSKQHWVNAFPEALPKLPQQEKYIWIDNNGNSAIIGEYFSAAQELQTYPIKIYWLQRISHKAPQNKEYLERIKSLLKL